MYSSTDTELHRIEGVWADPQQLQNGQAQAQRDGAKR